MVADGSKSGSIPLATLLSLDQVGDIKKIYLRKERIL